MFRVIPTNCSTSPYRINDNPDAKNVLAIRVRKGCENVRQESYTVNLKYVSIKEIISDGNEQRMISNYNFLCPIIIIN